MNTLVCLLALLPGQQSVQLNPIAISSDSTVNINYVKVMTIQQWQNGVSPQKLADQAAAVVAKHGRENKASIVLSDGLASITMGSSTVLKVSKSEGLANKSDHIALANLWANNINSALELPILNFGQKNVVVPEGGSISVPFFGSAALKSRIDSDQETVLTKANPGSLTLFGKKVGKSTVSATYGNFSVSIEATILPLAAKFPQTVHVEVMGHPTDSETVSASVASAVRNQISALPGAVITADFVQGREVGIGSAFTFNVPVRVTAPGSFPTSGQVQVVVRNVGAGQVQEDLLWYSNVPENLLGDGQIYWGRLNQAIPVRVLSHHYNKTSRPITVQYVLINRDTESAKVATIIGDALAGPDPAKVGYFAGKDFFNRWLNHSGEIVEIPPMSMIPLFIRRLSPTSTMSGMASLRLFQGSSRDVILVAYARYSEDLPSAFVSGIDKERPWQYMRAQPISTFDLPINGEPKEVYRRPFKNINFDYQVGGKFAFIRIGQEPISSPDGQQKLLGNFGVHYTIEGVLTNPTVAAQDVEIEFEASAGYSGAFFLVNNEFVDGKMMQSKQKLILIKKRIEPGQEFPVRIQTMPLSGAHYPATITVRPVGHSNE